jgi:hypothetical protein
MIGHHLLQQPQHHKGYVFLEDKLTNWAAIIFFGNILIVTHGNDNTSTKEWPMEFQ